MKSKGNIIWKSLICLTFCFLCMGLKKENMQADVIYMPDDIFAKEHEVEEYRGGRTYKVEDEEMVNCHESPESECITHNLALGDEVEVYYLYKDAEGVEWACIGKEKWLVSSNLKLVYDDIEFRKDYAEQIKGYAGELEGYCLTCPLEIYEYPGAKQVREVFIKQRFEPWENEWFCHAILTPQEVYVAEDGTVWGYVDFYRYGRHRGWYCISQLSSGVVQDYDGDCLLTVQDCFIALKKALKVPQEEAIESRFTVDVVTLQGVQQMLHKVLKIG